MNTLQRWFRQWSMRLERFLFGCTLLCLFLLVTSQLIMTNGKARSYLNRVEFIEGVPYRWPEAEPVPEASGAAPGRPVEGIYWIELALREGGGTLEVLRNGVTAGVLKREGLVIYVNPGDLMEVRGEAEGGPAVVEIVSTGGLAYPRAGEKIETYGDYDLIGWAVPKDN